jgi:predicted Rossmann fold nucleotide-binding protein DprA/Smf involved in DNA uptake
MNERRRIVAALRAGCATIEEVAAHTRLAPEVVVRELFYLVRDGRVAVMEQYGTPVFRVGRDGGAPPAGVGRGG